MNIYPRVVLSLAKEENDETRMTAEALRDVYGAMETNDDKNLIAARGVPKQRDCLAWIAAILLIPGLLRGWADGTQRPNVLVVIADQWRAQAFGFAGDPNVKTPNFDALARSSVRCVNAVSGMPVCSPTRASFFTGQRPLTHGVFINDVPLDPNAVTIGKTLRAANYETGFIGKWHVDGHGRLSFIPPERRQGFDYWKVCECTHNYTDSIYYGDSPEKAHWSGYDAIDQTKDAVQYLRDHAKAEKPFVLFLAWGPPHDPYLTAPEQYRALYRPDTLQLRANVPEAQVEQTRKYLAGYYAHCSALDDCMGQIRAALDETGLAENTVLVFTADHGDMLGSQGLYKKQKPYDESIRVPLLFHWPRGLGTMPRELDAPTNSEDLMPTLLGLCGAPIPKSVEGLDYSGYLRGGKSPGDGATVILCAAPFGEWDRKKGGKEYRGVRTTHYTYVRDLQGPWLLFDDKEDPLQMRNLIGDPARASLQADMDALLARKLRERGDAFLPGDDYIKKWGWMVDANGTAPTAP
jgi:arylsulfatase A-like enzyme